MFQNKARIDIKLTVLLGIVIAVLNFACSKRSATAEQIASNLANSEGSSLNPSTSSISPSNSTTLPTPTSSGTTTTSTPEAPAMLAPLQNVNLTAGKPLSVTVAVTGTAPFNYAWLKNGNPIANQNTQTLSIAAVSATDAATYSVVVSNSVNIATAEFVLTVVPAEVAPAITTAPVEVYGRYNENTGLYSVTSPVPATPDLVAFTVAATGTNLTYQWYYLPVATTANPMPKYTAISGATAPTYSFTLGDATPFSTYDAVNLFWYTYYEVLVSNAAGSQTASVTLSVKDFQGPIGGGNK